MDIYNTIPDELEIFMHLNDEKKPLDKEDVLDKNTIQAFGTTFKFAKARDFEIIVDTEGRINFTKLLTQITGDRNKLKHICEHNSSILEVIRSYDKEKILIWRRKFCSDMVASNAAITQDENISFQSTMTISQLQQAGIFINHSGKPNNIAGTYGPRYLLDILIILTRPSYYKLIHELLETIDEGSHLKNRSFDEELRRTIAQKQEENEQLKTRIHRMNRENDRSFKRIRRQKRSIQEKLDELIKINKEQTNQLHEANNKLQDVQGRVIDMQGHLNGHLDRLDQSTKFINEHFTSNNTTFMAINECLTIFPSQDLINNWPNELQANEIIYDVFAGNSDRKYQHNSMFKPNRAYHISEEEFNEGYNNHMIRCANGKDLLRYVRSNMPERLGTFLPDSKLITSNLNDVKAYVQGCVGILLQRNKQTVVHSLDEIRNAITRDFEERFGQLKHEVHDEVKEAFELIHDEINQNFNQVHEDVNNLQDQMHASSRVMNRNIEELMVQQEEIREELHRLTTRDMLLQTYPNIQTENLEGYINKRYRTFRIDDEGRIWFQPYVGAQDIELSLDELQTIILRDRNGHRYRNGQVL